MPLPVNFFIERDQQEQDRDRDQTSGYEREREGFHRNQIDTGGPRLERCPGPARSRLQNGPTTEMPIKRLDVRRHWTPAVQRRIALPFTTRVLSRQLKEPGD